MYDLIIKNAYLEEFNGTFDIAINDKLIKKIEKNIVSESRKFIDANFNLVTPGFIDAHTHLDKVLTIEGTESFNLFEAICNFKSRYHKFSEEDIKSRATKVIHMAIKNGTIAIRTHIAVDQRLGLLGIKVISDLKEQFKDIIDIQIVAMPSHEDYETNKELINLLDKSVEFGVDLYGGAPSVYSDPFYQTDFIFKIAKGNNLPIDFHIDETDEATSASLEYLARKTIKENMEGRVTASHCCGLSYVHDKKAKKVIELVKEAHIDIVTLPSCNMFLMSRNDTYPKTRGVTRVQSFLDAGVNISFASDNIQDPFRPFGNADMLEEALFSAQVLQMGTISQLKSIFKMGTYNPAKLLGLKNYGIKEGNFASLIIFDARTIDEAIITQATKLFVIRKGSILVENKREIIYSI